jgi:hypothetical protein
LLMRLLADRHCYSLMGWTPPTASMCQNEVIDLGL